MCKITLESAWTHANTSLIRTPKDNIIEFKIKPLCTI
jgi:hypothetical protein